MSIVDTKPFMLPGVLHSIFAHRPQVTGNRALAASAAAFVEYLYILCDIPYRFPPGPIPAVMNKLLLESPPETLHRRIIIAVPFPVHRGLQPEPRQYISVLMRAVLAATV